MIPSAASVNCRAGLHLVFRLRATRMPSTTGLLRSLYKSSVALSPFIRPSQIFKRSFDRSGFIPGALVKSKPMTFMIAYTLPAATAVALCPASFTDSCCPVLCLPVLPAPLHSTDISLRPPECAPHIEDKSSSPQEAVG